MKRIVSLLLSVLMVFTMLPVSVFAEDISEVDITEPVEIASSEDFAAMESDGNYVLIRDITVEEPLDFSGTFDGGNHTIYGVPFGTLTNATVKNLNVEAEISGYGGDYEGLLASTAENSVLFNNHTSGEIWIYNNDMNHTTYAAGLVAKSMGTTIIACSSSANIDVTNYSHYGSVGGITAYAGEGCIVLACYSTGDLTSLHESSNGMITCSASYIDGSRYNATVKCCYGTGNLESSLSVGGTSYNNADAVLKKGSETLTFTNGIPLAEMKTAAFAAQLQSDLDAALEEFAPEYAGQFIWYQPEANALPECTTKEWMVEGPSLADLSYGTIQDPAPLSIRNCTGVAGSVVSVSSTSELFHVSGGNYDQMAQGELAEWTVIPPETFEQGYYETVLNIHFSDGSTKQLPLRYSIGPCTPVIVLEPQQFAYTGESPTPEVQVLLPEDSGHVYEGDIIFTYYQDGSVIEPPVEVGKYYMQASIHGVEGNENYTAATSEKVALVITENDPNYCGAEGNGSNLTWALNDDGTLIISGQGAMADFSTTPWTYKTDLIKAVSIAEGVTTIGKNAFRGCQSLASVELPESLISIGENAFENCTALTTINLSSSLATIEAYAFKRSGLTEIDIPANVSTLGEGAFQECRSLRTVVLPEGITELAPNMFSFCYLDSLTLPSSVRTIAKGSIEPNSSGIDLYYLGTEHGWDSVKIDTSDDWLRDEYWVKVHFSGLTKDYYGACGDDLTWYLTKDGVLTISGTGAMYDYEWQTSPWYGFGDVITKIIVEDGITAIGNYAFSNIIADSVTLPEGIVSIGEGAFFRMTNMSALDLPESLETIGPSAFSGCGSLWNINLPNGLKTIGYSAFYGCCFHAFVIPDHITNLGTFTFDSCTRMDAIIFPNSHSSVVKGICDYCIDLKEVAIPDGYTTIEAYAFRECRTLTAIYIPASITSIDGSAFMDCSTFTDVYYAGTQAQWEGIAISNLRAPLANATIHFEHEHTMVTEPTVDPTPTNIGYTEHIYCSDCNFVVKPKNIILHLEEIIPAVAPTCTESGLTEGVYCPVCNEVLVAQETVDALGHTEVIDPAMAPTCMVNGLTEGSHCSVCGEILIAQQEIFAQHDWMPTLNSFTERCSFCGVTRTVALSGYCGAEGDGTNLSWVLDADGTLTISGTGRMADYESSGSTPWSGKSFLIEKVVLGSGVTSVGSEAFNYCSALTEVSLPDSVTDIGYDAFSDCTKLTQITLPDNLTNIGSAAFLRCASLPEITIPDSVQTIGGFAFAGCDTLTEIVIPATVTTVGGSAFSGCDSLRAAVILSSTAYSDYMFMDCATLKEVTLPAGMSDIPDYMFTRCESLNKINLPSSLISIGTSAFWDCKSLEQIAIPAGVTAIENSAFRDCSLLSGITIPNGVTTIEAGVFWGCSSLTEITIHSNITSFHGSALADCASLVQITVESENPEFMVIDGVLYSKDQKKLLLCPAGLKPVTFTIPDTVTTIGDYAFCGCRALTSVTIPNTVTYIKDSAFSHCTALPGIIIPTSVTRIGGSAFSYCASLTEIAIPDSVTYLGSSAFYGCTALRQITLSNSLSRLESSLFSGCVSLAQITIPNSVASIEYCAFENCTALTQITIPASITSVGASTFANCAALTKIVFEGNAPSFSWGAFRNVTATAYYPADNESWTESVLQNYEGSVTWVSYGSHIHTEEIIPAIAATCTETGLTAGVKCTDCGEILVAQNEVAALGHTEVIDEAVQATCTATGLTEGKHCSVCNEVLVAQVVVSAKGHTEVVDEAVAPTCTATGLTEGKHCSVCNEVLVAQTEVAALGHSWGDWITITEPTETTEGEKTRTCTACGVVEKQAIPVLEHSHSYTSVVTDPSCMEQGYTTYTCACGDNYVSDYVDAKGHTEVIDAAVAPTCTKTGLTEGKHCSVCNEVLVAQIVVAVKGHSWTEANCLAPKTCTSCGVTEGEPSQNHNGLKILTSDNNGWLLADGVAISPKGTLPAGAYYLGDNITIATTIKIASNVKICLNGKVLQYQSTKTGPVFYVSSGALYICDCGTATHGYDRENTGLWVWNDEDGDYRLTGGAITGGTGYSSGQYGGAVFISSGAFELHGGNLVGNTATYGGAIAGDKYYDHTVRICDSRIVGNVANGGDGGAIYTRGLGSSNGQYDELTTLVVSNTRIDQNVAEDGGAIAGGGNVTLEDCVLRENSASYAGGAVYMTAGSLALTDCTVTKNTAAQNSGGMHVAAPVTVSGLVCIYDNVCTAADGTANLYVNSNSAVITIAEALSSESRIGIKLPSNRVFTSGGGSAYRACFVSEDASYHIADSEGELCFETHVEETIPAVSATCTESGLTAGAKCSVCDKVLVAQTEVAALGHTEIVDTAVAPTCTETGLTEGKRCSVCNEVLVAQTEVAALGHSWGEWITITEPTETTEGEKTRTCTACGEVEKQSIPVLEHSHSYTDVVTEPTCMEQGYTTYTCSCGDSYVGDYVDAKGHTEEIDKAVAPSCTATGLTEGKHCFVCNEILVAQTEVAALGHSWGEWVTITEPTETIEGEKTRTCTACGVVEKQAIPVLEHSHSYTGVVTEPTCMEKGYTTYTCACGDNYVSDYVDALGHTEVIDEAVEATCTETGLTEGKHCSMCNEVLVAQIVVAVKGHSWTEANCLAPKTCTSCGVTEGEPSQGHSGLKMLTGDNNGWLLVDGVAVSSKGTLPAGNYYLGDNITIDTTININSDVKICLNGMVLQYQSEKLGSVFFVSHGDLYVCDCGTAIHGYDRENTGLWVWNDEDGDYRLTGGAITGGTGYSYGQYGGAVFISSGSFELHGGNLIGNTAADGGAIAGGPDYNTTIRIYDSRIVGNVTNGGDGGGIYTRRVYENGVLKGVTTLVVTDTLIDQNVAQDGGAIAGGGDVTLVNCVLRRNRATYSGGAIRATDGSLSLTDCTITENTAARNSGGIYSMPTISVSGVVCIYDNVCETEGEAPNLNITSASAVLMITDDFSEESCIKLRRYQPESGVFTSGGGDAYRPCFISDEPDYHIAASEGELRFEAHVEETIPAVSATCTESGLTAGAKCSVCDKVLVAQTEVAALGHTEIVDTAVAPTCTETGLTEGKHCSVCNEIFVDQTEVAALGHSWGEWITITEPTETTEGEKTRTCSTCGEVEKQSIPVLEHSHSYTDVVTEPTCMEQGYTTYTCSCGDSYVGDYVDAKGHAEVIDAAVAPTCTATGLTEGKHCSVCNEVLVAQTVVAAKGHTEVIDEAVASTCTATGLTEGKHCSVCNEILVAQTEVAALGHSWGEWITITEPTETTEGEKTRICSACGEEEKQNIPVLEHSHSYTGVVTEPTCMEKGYTTYTCSCGDSYVSDYVDALGHTEVIDEAVEATCTETGLTEGKHCSVCNEVLVAQTVIAAKGHTEVIDAAVAPTCTATGLTEGKHCSVCNEVLVAQTEVAALGHNWGEWITITEPTETTEGEKARTCTTCGEVEKENIPVLEHSHSYAGVVTEPTCMEKGYTTYTCACGDSYVSDYVDAKGHAEAIDAAVAPTCTATGLTEGKHCSVCNEVLVAQVVVAAKGHTEVIDAAMEATCTATGLTEGKHCSVCNEVLVAQTVVAAKGHTEVIDEAVASTCTATGLTEGKQCSVCNEVLVAQTEVAALGHSWGAWITITEPTETTEGEKARTCTACGEVEKQSIPVLEHSHSYAGVVTEPTCMEKGYTTYTCACGDSYVSDYVDALGHTEVIDAAVVATCTETGLTEGKHCSACNEVLVAQTVVNAKGHAEVVDAAVAPTCRATGLTEGKHCSVCNEVLVAQTVVAAMGHTEVTDAAVAPTCTATGLTEGKHCSVCNEVLVAQSVVPMTEHSWVNTPGVFMQECTVCKTTREVDVLTGREGSVTWSLTKDGTLTFYGAGVITEVDAIAPFADSVKRIVIESDVSGVKPGAFSDYSAQESFTVSEDNPNLTSQDGVLFGKEEAVNLFGIDSDLAACGMTELLAYPLGRTDTSYTVPGTNVAPLAFAGNPYLTSVSFGENVEQIAQSAFSGCTALTEANLPASLQTIGVDAFKDCPLSKVFYAGEPEDWAKVKLETGEAENDPLQKVEPVYYTVKAQWNLTHTVLSIVGLPADAQQVFVAFTSENGQMVKLVICTPQQIMEGIDISDGNISMKNCTAKIMMIGEHYAPVMDSLYVK